MKRYFKSLVYCLILGLLLTLAGTSTAHAQDSIPLSKPTNLQVSCAIDGRTAVLSWDSVPFANKYSVQLNGEPFYYWKTYFHFDVLNFNTFQNSVKVPLLIQNMYYKWSVSTSTFLTKSEEKFFQCKNQAIVYHVTPLPQRKIDLYNLQGSSPSARIRALLTESRRGTVLDQSGFSFVWTADDPNLVSIKPTPLSTYNGSCLYGIKSPCPLTDAIITPKQTGISGNTRVRVTVYKNSVKGIVAQDFFNVSLIIPANAPTISQVSVAPCTSASCGLTTTVFIQGTNYRDGIKVEAIGLSDNKEYKDDMFNSDGSPYVQIVGIEANAKLIVDFHNLPCGQNYKVKVYYPNFSNLAASAGSFAPSSNYCHP